MHLPFFSAIVVSVVVQYAVAIEQIDCGAHKLRNRECVNLIQTDSKPG